MKSGDFLRHISKEKDTDNRDNYMKEIDWFLPLSVLPLRTSFDSGMGVEDGCDDRIFRLQ